MNDTSTNPLLHAWSSPFSLPPFASLRPGLPEAGLGGLHSPQDGQLDPTAAMAALLADGRRRGLVLQATHATAPAFHAFGEGEGLGADAGAKGG